MTKIRTMLSLAAAFAISLSSTAMAEETVLRLSTWAGTNHPINSQVLTQWSEDISQATDGRVSIEMLHDIAPPPRQMETVADQVADIGWIFHGFVPGRFELTKVAEFPLEGEYTAEQVSVAYWRTHKEYLEQADEHRGLKVLGVGVHGPGQLLTAEPVSGFQDLSSKRIRVGGGMMSDVAEKLVINQVALPTPEIYQAISQGVVDGTFLALEPLKSMNLVEVSPYVYTVPGGMYGGTFSIFMNPDVWNDLSDQDRTAIESVSYEHLSRLFGSVMHNADVVSLEYALENGAVVTQATDADVAVISSINKELKQEWVADTQKHYGIDSARALEFFNQELESLK